jgi:hypothetical protein
MWLTKYAKGNQSFFEFIPVETAGIGPFATKIYMAVGCDVLSRDIIIHHPLG